MRVLILYMLYFIYSVQCKTHSRSLTEALGREIIEIGAPIKGCFYLTLHEETYTKPQVHVVCKGNNCRRYRFTELPIDLEEEPSVENDEDVTSTTLPAATKKDVAGKPAGETDKKPKDIDKIDGVKQEDEEARIEKELSEIYKDTSAYKSDSSEMTDKTNSTENSTLFEDKPVARMRTNFKFQPNSNNEKDIDLFRTSVDEISCERNKLSGYTTSPDSGFQFTINTIVLGVSIISPLLFSSPLLV